MLIIIKLSHMTNVGVPQLSKGQDTGVPCGKLWGRIPLIM